MQTRQAASEGSRAWLALVVFWVLAIAVTGALLVLRRPDAVFHAQFWAEDGVVWYAEAYNFGALPALLHSRDGYLQTLPRLGASVALSAPLLHAPLVMNLIALLFEALPALFLVSSRMQKLGPLALRCGLALLYLSVPDSSELHAIITDSQWNLAVLVCLVLIAEAPRSRAGQVFDVAALVLCGVSGPFCILLIPVALVRAVGPLLSPQSTKAELTRPARRWPWVQLSLLAAGGLLQGLTLLAAQGTRLDMRLGATAAKFSQILAGQIVLPVFIGSNRLDQLSNDPAIVTALAFLLTVVSALVFLYALRRGSLELQCFVLFALLVLMASLAFPTVEPVHFQWDAFVVPGQGLRYWYVPKLALMATLIWLLGRHRPVAIRAVAGVLVCVMVFSAVKHWRYPAFPDFQFERYVQVFEQLPSGATGQFRLNPGGPWIMTLVKK